MGTAMGYPKEIKRLVENPYLFSFMVFPKTIRRSIYSTKLIESQNKRLKSHTSHKEQSPNQESKECSLVTQYASYNNQFGQKSHTGFSEAESELLNMFW